MNYDIPLSHLKGKSGELSVVYLAIISPDTKIC